MKTSIKLSATLMMLSALSFAACGSGHSKSGGTQPETQAPLISDANLEARIRAQLQAPIPDTQQLTEADLETLTYLNASGYGLPDEQKISSLSGMEYCINLNNLDLHSNKISDFSALTGLTSLAYLQIRSNLVTDISVLQNLTLLTDLNLRNNSITDITALINNTGLRTGDNVYLTGNSLADPDQVDTLRAKGVTVTY